MSFSVELTDHFVKEAKKLAKKYSSLKAELSVLGKELSENPTLGKSLGHDVYKVRLAISSKGKGKSGGARVITFVKVEREKVYLVSIYDKGQIDTITKYQIKELLNNIGLI